jgi:hypothetical protein
MGPLICKFVVLYAQILGVIAAMLAAVFLFRILALGPSSAFDAETVHGVLSWFGIILAIGIPAAILILAVETIARRER